MNISAVKSVRLWTIQPWEVWEALQVQKTLLVDPSHPNFGEEEFVKGYEWMRQQMRQRLPSYEGGDLWWGYDYKLDLRSWRYQCSLGRYVRIEVALPTDRVLLSAYGAWHFVMSHWYLPYSADNEGHERESDAWDAELEQHGFDPFGEWPPEPWRSRIIASWQRIFDVEDLRETNTIQGCFERLNLADVVRVTEFQALGRR